MRAKLHKRASFWTELEAAGIQAAGGSIRAEASGEILAEEGRLAVDDHSWKVSAAAHSIEEKNGSYSAAKINPLGELSFDPEIEITVRRSKALRNREVAARVLKENYKQMAE
ncbi:OLC1v1022743C1, partial [Oldenlandia corymbosa var. corymbosa]